MCTGGVHTHRRARTRTLPASLPAFCKRFTQCFPSGKFSGLRVPSTTRKLRMRVSFPGQRGKGPWVPRFPQTRTAGFHAAGEGIRGSGARRSLGWTIECEGRGGILSRRNTLTILVKAKHKKGVPGAVPPNPACLSQGGNRTLRISGTNRKIPSESSSGMTAGVPVYPDFRSV